MTLFKNCKPLKYILSPKRHNKSLKHPSPSTEEASD